MCWDAEMPVLAVRVAVPPKTHSPQRAIRTVDLEPAGPLLGGAFCQLLLLRGKLT
jgi:hypothetical protein